MAKLIPSIKGSVIGGHAEVLGKHLADGSITRGALARRFEAHEIAILEGAFAHASWYDVGLYGRLLELLRDEVGDGDNLYLVQAGARTATRLIEAGVHQQMDYLKRTQHRRREHKEERSAAFGRDLRLLETITGALLNFGRSAIVPDPDYALRWMIEKHDVEAYPEAVCWTTLGFCNRMAEEHGDPDLWYWERPSAGLIRFRMRREV
jgi:hypothetical protein